MKTNTATRPAIPAPTTHEGARAARLSPEHELQRTVNACLLFEDSFYESGVESAKRIREGVAKADPQFVASLAMTARTAMKLRHVPLLLVREMARLPNHKGLVAQTLSDVIQRPDEITEFLALYWAEKRQPLSAQVKKGLARAFRKFDEHSLAKYDQDNKVKLRDALFLSHAKPKDATVKFTKLERKSADQYELNDHELLYKRIVDRELATPDTWEVQLSAGADKRETFERLMVERKLGGLAFLRNLRNMKEAGVDKKVVAAYMDVANFDRVLPFRFIAAANVVPVWEDVIERGMLRCLERAEKLPGRTVLLIDGSGSMQEKVSAKSDISRRDAATALAILLREICEDVAIIAFSNEPWDIPPRRGFALREAIAARVVPTGTLLGKAVRYAQAQGPCNRIIVITDEQSADVPPAPKGTGYVINVAGYKNGIGYGPWVHIDGWSEAILSYIRVYESTEGQ
jgi:60 kDa SS-A/Ro ribonucleoprotein